jgi:hypothetical protein
MFQMKRLRLLPASLLFSVCLAPVASANDFDGSKSLQCIPTDLFECARGVECWRTTADEINIPQFITVDFAKKTIGGIVKGEPQSSPIERLHLEHGRTIFMGSEGGNVWGALIDQASGKMSISVAATTGDGHPVGFSILGVCTAR